MMMIIIIFFPSQLSLLYVYVETFVNYYVHHRPIGVSVGAGSSMQMYQYGRTDGRDLSVQFVYYADDALWLAKTKIKKMNKKLVQKRPFIPHKLSSEFFYCVQLVISHFFGAPTCSFLGGGGATSELIHQA